MNYNDADILYFRIKEQMAIAGDISQFTIDKVISAINVFYKAISLLDQKETFEKEKMFELWHKIAYLTGIILPKNLYRNLNDNASVIELQLIAIENLENITEMFNFLDENGKETIKLYFEICLCVTDYLLLKRNDLMKSIEIFEKLCTKINFLYDNDISNLFLDRMRNLAQKYIYVKIIGIIEKKYGYLGKEIARIHFEKVNGFLGQLLDFSKSIGNIVQGYMNTAIEYMTKGMPEESLRYINLAIQKDPRDYRNYSFRGYIYRIMNNYENSEKDFIRAIASTRNIDDYRPYYYLGAIYNEMKEYRKAIKCLSKVLEKLPEDKYANNAIGISYRNIDDIDKALFYTNKALQCDSEYLHAINNRAQLYLILDRISEAINDCEYVIKLRENDDIAHNNLGLAYAIISNYEKAHYHFSMAICINKNNICAKDNIAKLEQNGVSYFKNISFTDAGVVTELDKMNKTDDEDIILYYIDFVIRDLLKKQILAIKPKIPEDKKPDLVMVACNLINRQKYKQAIDILKKIEEKSGYRIDVYFLLGLAYLKRGCQYLLIENFQNVKYKTGNLNEDEIDQKKNTMEAIGKFKSILKNEKGYNYYILNAHYFRSLAYFFSGKKVRPALKDIVQYYELYERNAEIKKPKKSIISLNDYVQNNIKNNVLKNKKLTVDVEKFFYYRKMLKTDPLNLDAMSSLANIYIFLGNYREALNVLNQVVYIYAFYVNSFKELSDLKMNKDKINLIKCYLTCNNITDELYIQYLCFRSKANYSLDLVDNALADCEEALRKDQNNLFAGKLMESYRGKKAANGIIADMLGYIAEISDNSIFEKLMTKGLDKAKSGSFNEAIKYFSRAIMINPDRNIAYRMRALAYLGLKDMDSAYAGFKEASLINKNDSVSMRWMSRILQGIDLDKEITELLSQS